MRALIAVMLVGILGATACAKGGLERGADASPQATGRYVGIGIYEPGELWAKLAQAKAPDRPDSTVLSDDGAVLSDDGAVIVVVDSYTGQVRQCGNLSGVCISMDPWKQAIGPGLSGPVALTEHAPPPGEAVE